MVKKNFILALAFILIQLATSRSQAIDFTTEQREQMLAEFAAADPEGYEDYRAGQARAAKSLDEFLDWATPEEIADDLDLSMAERLFEETSGAAAVNVTIHLRSQTMDATGGGLSIHGRRVATGRPGYETPLGCHMAFKGEKVHLSRKYNNYPMVNSVFFVGGDAFHVGNVNHKSHGCVHLDPATSKAIFNAYMKNKKSFRVCVVK